MFKKCLLLAIILLFLNACVPAALVAGAAGSAVIYDKRSFKTMSNDQRAREWAQRLIDKDAELNNRSHITIAVFNGVCLLVGQAQTPAIRDRAFEIVSHVKNINKIYNEVSIDAPTADLLRMSDSWITTKVRATLLSTAELRSNNIKVVTEDGVVYLMGNIERSQAEFATESVRHIKGVKKVIKVFDYS